MKDTLDSLSIANLILNIFLAIGFKYLWNMVTLLQFVIFMKAWLILLPDQVDSMLTALKSLALFEFIPTKDIMDAVLGFFGVSEEEADDSEMEQESFLDKLAVFILAGILIMIILLILAILRLLISCCPKLQRCFQAIKRKIFYGTFISYLLLGTLKI